MQTDWFDPATGMMRFDEIVAGQPSFQKVMADSVVTGEEFREQAARVEELMRQLDARLPEETKPLVTETLAELVVLMALTGKLANEKQKG